jgi:sugar-specific transcriptional regulator TrmB
MHTKLLQSLGLDSREVKLYQVIFKAKEITPTDLAKEANIKRTSAYSMARGLVEKGLVLENATKRPRTFSVAGSDEVAAAIEIEKKRSEERQELLSEIGALVDKEESSENYPVPLIRFIEENRVLSHMSSRIGTWTASMCAKDTTFWGYQDPTLLDTYESWIGDFWKQAPENFEVKLLTNNQESEKKISGKYKRRFTKFWSAAQNFNSTTWIMGDYVVILNTKQHPYYLIEIEDAFMAHDQREVFRGLWDVV